MPPERHSHPHRCPFCDRAVESGGCNRGWCKVCYTRWRKAGKPDGGPARAWANRKPRTRTCAACGHDKPIQGKEMCKQCYATWYKENRSGTCAKCGLKRKLHVGDLCVVCYHRQHRDYDAETLARWNRREQLDTLRITWALAHPGQPGNPYECNIIDCHATANSGLGYLCVTHYHRIYSTGRHDRDPCVKCCGELDSRAERLCSGCYGTWRYCEQPSHQGDRLLPVSEFGNQRGAYCRECLARKYFPRKCHCERCGREPVRNGGASLCQECSESWFYCGSAVHRGDRLLSLEETCERENGNRRCIQCYLTHQKNSRPKVLPCLACGRTAKIAAHGWCGSCYNRWRKAGKPTGGPPSQGRVGAYPKAPQCCPSCGETRKIECGGWCGPCYSRWLHAGKPESGPPPVTWGRKYPKDPRPCPSCGQTKRIECRGWCAACYQRWRKAARPADGPPSAVPARLYPEDPAPCSSCGQEKRIIARGWCGACWMRWAAAGKPDSGPPSRRRESNAA